MNRRHSGQFGALLTGVLLVCRVAGAGDGTWTNVAGGNWSTVGNWSGGVADGIGSTAYFNTIDIVSDAVVNLDSSRTNGNLFFGDISGVQSWILSSASAATFTLDVAAGTPVISVSNNAASISTAILGLKGLVKSGAGNLVLSGTSEWGAVNNLNAGTLTVTGVSTGFNFNVGSFAGSTGIMVVAGTGIHTATNNPLFNIGSVAGSFGVLKVQDSAFLSVLAQSGSSGNGLFAGNANGACGAVYQSGGTVLVNNQFLVGNIGYGFYQLTGGLLNPDGAAGGIGRFRVTGNTGAIGLFYQSSGTATSPVTFQISCNAGVSSPTGLVWVSGGTFSDSGGIQLGGVAEPGVPRAELVVDGTASVSTPGNNITIASASNALSTVTLKGGTLQVNQVTRGSGTSIFNFNGGTLKAGSTNANFMQGLSGACIYSGGAVVDTTNMNITIAQNLLAPTGYGVTSIVLGGAGSGYIGPPYVEISGGNGTGATALANVNTTNGTVTNVMVTCPGWGYKSNDVLVVRLVGGGGSNAAVSQVFLGANTGGGLLKKGSGTLTLSGTNTFTGSSRIIEGLLAWGSAGAMWGSTLDLNGSDSGAWSFGTNSAITIGGLAGSRNLALTNSLGNPLALTVGNNGYDTVYSGVLSGGGWLTKEGGGVLALSANNTYTGPTWVANGMLLVDGALAGGASMIVTNGAFLGGTGTVNSAVSLYDWAGLSPAGTNIGTLVINSNLTVTNGLIYNWQYNGVSGNADLVNVSGNLSLPPVATVNVSRVSGGVQPFRSVLFSYGGNCDQGNFDGWVVNGACGYVSKDVTLKQIVLVYGGTVLRIK